MAGSELADLFVTLRVDSDRYDRGLRDSDAAGERFATRATSHFGTVGKAVLGLGTAFAAVGAVDFLAGTVSTASGLAETISKSRTIFGSAAADIESWGGSAATALGQSKQQAIDAAATFGNLFSQLGIGSDETAQMSKDMVQLATDFASFHNADISDVLLAQQAAFRGEYDAVQRFVPTINAAAVEQKALAMGLANTSKELDAQDKALATQQLLLEGAGAAVGDFSRTSGGLANQQRILGATFENAKAKLGEALLPVVTKATTLFADALPGALDASSKALSDAGAIASEFFNALSTGMTEDEGTPVEEFALQVREALLTVRDVAVEVVGWVRAHWGDISARISEVLATARSVISGFVNVVSTLWSNFGDNLMEYVNRVWPQINKIISGALEMIRGIVKTITALIHGDWGQVWDGIKQILSGAWTYITGVIGMALEAVRALLGIGLEIIGSVFKDAWDRIQSGVADGFRAVIELFAALPGQIITALGDFASLLLGVGTDIVGGLLSSMQEKAFEAIGWVMGLPGEIVGALGDGLQLLHWFAVDVVVGFWRGIESMWGWLWGKVTGFFSGIWDGVKGFFGARSPSRLAMDLGYNVIEGYALGIESNTGRVLGAHRRMLAGIGSAVMPDIVMRFTSAGLVGTSPTIGLTSVPGLAVNRSVVEHRLTVEHSGAVHLTGNVTDVDRLAGQLAEPVRKKLLDLPVPTLWGSKA